MELDSEKRNHAETIKILRKKERTVKEIVIQCEEDQKNVIMLQEQLDKAVAKLNAYKRQLSEVVNILIDFIFNQHHLNLNLFYRRDSPVNQLPVNVVSNANWKLLKNVLKLQKVI